MLVDSYPLSGQTVSGHGVSTLDAGSPELRLVDAVLRCISRWGVAKTTLDDVAREAGCSRATVAKIAKRAKQPEF